MQIKISGSPHSSQKSISLILDMMILMCKIKVFKGQYLIVEEDLDEDGTGPIWIEGWIEVNKREGT